MSAYLPPYLFSYFSPARAAAFGNPIASQVVRMSATAWIVDRNISAWTPSVPTFSRCRGPCRIQPLLTCLITYLFICHLLAGKGGGRTRRHSLALLQNQRLINARTRSSSVGFCIRGILGTNIVTAVLIRSTWTSASIWALPDSSVIRQT